MNRAARRGAIGGGVIAAAVALIGAWEGVKTVAYRDIAGIPTVCFGETRGVKMGDRYTLEQCQAMLGDAILEFEEGIDRCLVQPATIPPLTKVSYLSLAYNIGVRAFCGSTVARRWNAGDVRGSCEAILAWNKARVKGVLKVVKGLQNRRAEEREYCLKGAAA